MLLNIHNLPSNALYQDVKTLIQEKCGITNIIVDNLQYEGKTKKVTVGLMNEDDAAIVSRKINGLFVNGEQLYVVNMGKNKSSEQPYKPSSTVTSQQQTQYQQASQYYYQSPDTFVPGMMINHPGSSQMMTQPGTSHMMTQPRTSQMMTNDFNYRPVYMPAPTSFMGCDSQGGMLSGPSTMTSFQQNWGQQPYSEGNMQSKTYHENNIKSFNSNCQQQNYNEWNQTSDWQNSKPKRPLERESLNDYQKNVGRDWAPQKNRGNAEPVRERSYSSYQNREEEGSKRKRQRKNKPSEGQRQLESNNRHVQWDYNTSNDNRNQNKFNDNVKTDTFVSSNRKRPSPQNFAGVTNNKQSQWTSSNVEPNHDAGRRDPISQRDPRSYERSYEQHSGQSNYYGANTFETNLESQKQTKNVYEKKPATARPGFTSDPYHYYAKAPSSTSKSYPDKMYGKSPNQMPFHSAKITPKYDMNTFEINKTNVNVPNWSNAGTGSLPIEGRPKKWQNWNTDYLMNRYARKTGSRPVVTKKLANLLRKDYTWRGQAVSQIMRQMFIHTKGRIKQNLKFQLKTCIRSRVEVVLGDDVGVQVHDIVQRYRQKFHQVDDASFLKAIKEKIKAYKKSERERLEKENEKALNKAVKPVFQGEVQDNKKPQENMPDKQKKVNLEGAIPKYPNADKKQFQQMKKAVVKEFTEEEPYAMEPTLKKALDDELDAIENLIVKDCQDKSLEAGFNKDEFEFISERLQERSIPEFKKLLRLMTTKRVLDIRTNLCFMIFGVPKLPQKQFLLQFLKDYGVIGLKKSHKHKIYTGNCDTFENYDKILKVKSTNIEGCTIKIKPFQLTGPPEKLNKADIKAERENRIKVHLETYDIDVDVGQKKPKNNNENINKNENQPNENVSNKNGDAENCQDDTNKRAAEKEENVKIIKELKEPTGKEENESNKETYKENEHNKETDTEGNGSNKQTDEEVNERNKETGTEVNERNVETSKEVNGNNIETDKEVNESNEEIEMKPDLLNDDMKSDENENHVDDAIDEEDEDYLDNIKDSDLEDY